MRNLSHTLIAVLLLGASAAHAGKPPARPPMAVSPAAQAAAENKRFGTYVHDTLEKLWLQFPEDALAAGRYDHADRMTVPDFNWRVATLGFLDQRLAELSGFDERKLTDANRVDLVLMRNEFESRRWTLAVFRDWEWQPSYYNVGDSFGRILTTDYAPMDTRLRQVLTRLALVPAYYAAGRMNINRPTLEHTQLAIAQNQGALDVLGADLEQSLATSGLSTREKALFNSRLASAREAITAYREAMAALLPQLKAGGARSFRIGKELYAPKFAYDIQSGWTAEQLYQRARDEKAKLHDQMEVLAKKLWPKYLKDTPIPNDRLQMIRAVLDALSKHHTTPKDFVATVRKQIPELEAFVRKHDLVTQDASRPLQVRETPVYMRGVAGASISSPGPYDPKANTYYNVDPLDDYTPEQAESYLREYNDWMLQVLNIHEAVPGHYTQSIHANKSKSVVKTLFGNGSMIEGWAVFGEKMMLDAGYGGNTPEMQLVWMKWNLRSVVNTILDYEVHTQGLERDAAISLLTRDAFQQQAEAEGKWKRVTLSQVQLTSYYNGYAEITALRDEQKAKLGKKFSVKRFNDRFLSFGSAPVKFIRELF